MSAGGENGMAGSTAIVAASASKYPELSGVRDGLLNQRLAELNRKGESISVMVAGDCGLGKSTLLSNLFAKRTSYEHKMEPTKRGIRDSTETLEIEGVPFKVRLIDTPGYGDYPNLNKHFNSITRYLDNEMVEMYKREKSPNVLSAFSWVVEGIDVLLYFISPHRLKQVDIDLLKKLSGRVTIIPILAKADTMTPKECQDFKRTVMDAIDRESIKIFHEPFAVISSENSRDNSTSRSSGRTYPWGTAESENEEFSDLPALRRCLVYDGLTGLHSEKVKIYEEYRNKQLTGLRPLRRILRLGVRTAIQVGLVALIFPYLKEAYVEWRDNEEEERNTKQNERYRRTRWNS
eukprot:CAMPEP_0184745222 /NCGR_PEP_ID=MMETSP0315-20130426/7870_1 /TAXON_ID=101924 /ORGANISM="Rhodosorus marinus, Strain UTEX LB 2760" /LENGTH=347 /DNA_ID=CAMNT_0027217245 /DNA_START=280 /DNA_END=1326 /DNA_ORIENTATION=-